MFSSAFGVCLGTERIQISAFYFSLGLASQPLLGMSQTLEIGRWLFAVGEPVDRRKEALAIVFITKKAVNLDLVPMVVLNLVPHD